MDQCYPLTRNKLEKCLDFPTFYAAKNPIALLAEMRNIFYGREAHMQDAQNHCDDIYKYLDIS